jgi:hypothetical protein
MVVNFRVREINRVERKLIRIPTLIKKTDNFVVNTVAPVAINMQIAN